MPEAYRAATPQIIRRSVSSHAAESTGVWVAAILLALTLAGCAHGTTSGHRTGLPAEPISPLLVSQQSTRVATAMQALEARLVQLQRNLRLINHDLATAGPTASTTTRSRPLMRRAHSAVPVAVPPRLPVARVAPKTLPAAIQPPAPPITIRHKVAIGDTLGGIAHHYLGRASRWREVWRANPWLRQPRHLRVGQTVRIPTATHRQDPALAIPGQTAQPPAHYTIQTGDSLGSIAQRHWGTAILWKRLWQANPALNNPHQIRVGQRLLIPASVTKPQQYMVQQGDSLSRLAMVYLGDAGLWRVLERFNPNLRRPRSLTPGQRLRLPAGSAPIPRA